jgi:hypothetical protein
MPRSSTEKPATDRAAKKELEGPEGEKLREAEERGKKAQHS